MLLVEKLRAVAKVGYTPRGAASAADWMIDAADEIERMRAALQEIAELGDIRADEASLLARRALSVTVIQEQ